MGGVAASAIALYFYESKGAHVLILMLIAGGIGGMLWAAIPAFLKTQFNTNEILVSLMSVYVAQLAASWLVHGPMIDPDGFNFPQTRMFEESVLLPILIEDTRLNATLMFEFSALLVGYVFHGSKLSWLSNASGWKCQ
jgi:simple sugar transport system permease protein